jgi:hypothetical protein
MGIETASQTTADGAWPKSEERDVRSTRSLTGEDGSIYADSAMNQSRYGTLLSLVLLLCLTAGFFLAARLAIQKVNNSVAKAIATPTVVVLPPTPTPRVQPTKVVTKKKPVVHVAPTATPSPASQGQIVVSTSSSMAGATTTFPASTSQYWCVANLPTTPLGTGIVWKWLHVIGNTTEEIWTSTPYTYNSVVRYGYIDGPFAPGRYRCEVIAGGTVMGAADFTVH